LRTRQPRASEAESIHGRRLRGRRLLVRAALPLVCTEPRGGWPRLPNQVRVRPCPQASLRPPRTCCLALFFVSARQAVPSTSGKQHLPLYQKGPLKHPL